MFAFYAFFYLWDKYKDSQWKKVAWPTIILLVLLGFQNTNYFDLGFKNVIHFHYTLGLSQTRQGNYEEAIKEFNTAIKKAPA
jgi:hypothetical protein